MGLASFQRGLNLSVYIYFSQTDTIQQQRKRIELLESQQKGDIEAQITRRRMAKGICLTSTSTLRCPWLNPWPLRQSS